MINKSNFIKIKHAIRKGFLPLLYLSKYRISNIDIKWIKKPEISPNSNEVILIVCGFGNDNYKKAAYRLAEQAKRLNRFTKIYVYTNLSDVPCLSQTRKSAIELLVKQYARGWGLWSWKPAVISAVMSFTPKGAEIFYIDAGCEISPWGQAQFDRWRLHLQKNYFLFFSIPYSECEWTAAFVLQHFMLPINLNSPQIQATWFGIINCEECLGLIDSWADECLSNNGMLLYSFEGLNNPYLLEHREDQSILSCIIKSRFDFEVLNHKDHFIPELYYRNSLVLKMPIHTLRQSSNSSKLNLLIEKSTYTGCEPNFFTLYLVFISLWSMRMLRESINASIKTAIQLCKSFEIDAK